MTIVPTDRPPASLRLGDVAHVVEDHQPLIGDAIVDDGDGLLLVVEKFPGANTLEVTRGVEEALAALAPGLAGIEIDTTVFRPATFIESAIDNLALALLLALVLVARDLPPLGFSIRAAIASLVAIAVSLTAAALVLYVLGATLNAIIVAGLVLAIGIVIDDAVVGVGEVRRRMRAAAEGEGQAATPILVQDATMQSRGPLAFATLVIAADHRPGVLPAGCRPARSSPSWPSRTCWPCWPRWWSPDGHARPRLPAPGRRPQPATRDRRGATRAGRLRVAAVADGAARGPRLRGDRRGGPRADRLRGHLAVPQLGGSLHPLVQGQRDVVDRLERRARHLARAR